MSSSSEEVEFDGEYGSSEDDIPLANFKKSKDNGDNDEEMEDADDTPSKRRGSRGGQISYADDDDDEEEESESESDSDSDSDSDDDIPLAALKASSPKKKKAPASNGTKKKKAPPAKKKTTVKKTATKTVSSSSSKGSEYKSASGSLYGSECQKGMLIQRLLCRWWYAIEWPAPSAIPSKPPQHYDALDGFPGVYVCTEGDEVGDIKDFRSKEECPNFKNFAKKSSDELQKLLIKALQEQKRQLIEAEGSGTPTEKELSTMLKWAQKVKPATAEKEATKVLKAAKLTLP